jgi:hypothetical protein
VFRAPGGERREVFFLGGHRDEEKNNQIDLPSTESKSIGRLRRANMPEK